jgi:hypothetical protein
LEKGKLIGRINVLQQILKQPATPEEELLQFSLDDLTRLAEELQRQSRQGQNGAS